MRNQVKTVILLGSLSALLIGLGAAVAPGQLWLFGLMALGINLGSYFYSDRIVLAMHGARELSPEEAPGLHRIVRQLAHAAGIPAPRLALLPEAQPNAFATGRNPNHAVVAVTEGILDLLNERELRGVLAHEIAHVKNRDILVSSIAAALASIITWVAQALSFGALFGSGSGAGSGWGDDREGPPAGGLLLALVAPLAATLVQLGISRSREYLADETGARLSRDPEALASALARLHEAAEAVPSRASQPATASLFIVSPLTGGGGGLLELFSTHPPIERRIARLESMLPPIRPRWPRGFGWQY